MFAVQQGSKSDTSKDWQPAPLPGVSTPLNIEGSITFCSFLSTQPYIVNATEITFKIFPLLKIEMYIKLFIYLGSSMCFTRDNGLYLSIWPKVMRKIYFSFFVYLSFYTFF